MSTLSKRLRRLEECQGELPCAVCGAQGSTRQFTVRFRDEAGTHATDDHCPGCKRRQVYHIQVDDRE